MEKDKNKQKITEPATIEQLMNMKDCEFTAYVKNKRGIYGKEHNKSVLQTAPQSLYEVEYKLKTSGRQWKHNLKNMLLLIESLKPFVITAKDDLRDFAISSHNARLVARFGTHPTVIKVLNTAVDLGLLIINNNRGCNNFTHIATTYIYNKQIEEFITLIAEQYGVAMATAKNAGGGKSSGKIKKTSLPSPLSPIRVNLRNDNENPSNINEFMGGKSSLMGGKSSGLTDKSPSSSLSPIRVNLRGGNKSSQTNEEENADYTINATLPDSDYLAEYEKEEDLLPYETKTMIWTLCNKLKTSGRSDHLTIAEAIESLIDFYEQNAEP